MPPRGLYMGDKLSPADPVSGSFRAHRTPRMPMGGWSEENQMSRHHDPVPEEGSEDELPPRSHMV